MQNSVLTSLSLQNTLILDLAIASLLVAIGLFIGPRKVSDWLIRVPTWRPAVVLAGIAAVSHWPFTVEPLWYDELYTRIVARLPVAGIFTASAGDVHPPGFYLIEKVATGLFGDSIPALRIVSYVAIVLCIPVLYWIFQRSGSGLSGLINGRAFLGALLFNFTYAATYYADESRMYALLTLCVLLLVLCLQYERYWLAIVVSVAAVWLHNIGWLYVALCWSGVAVSYFVNGWGWFRWRQYPDALRVAVIKTVRRFGLPGVGLVVALLPRLPGVLNQMRYTSSGEFWAGKLAQTGVNTHPGYYIDALRILAVGSRIDPILTIPITVVVFVAAVYALLTAVKRGRGDTDPDRWINWFARYWYVAALGICPLLVATFLPLEYLYRFYIPAIAVCCIGATLIDLRWLRIALVGCLAVAYISFYLPEKTAGRYDFGLAVYDFPATAAAKTDTIRLMGAAEEYILAGQSINWTPYVLDDLPGTFSHSTLDSMGIPYLTVDQACAKGQAVQLVNMNFEGPAFLHAVLDKYQAVKVFHADQAPIIVDAYDLTCPGLVRF